MLELSGASQHALQALEQGGISLLSQETISTEIIRKYRGKAAPALVQIQPAVFQPADISVPVLGRITTPSLPTVKVTDSEEDVQGSHHQMEIPVITFIWEGSGKGQCKSSSGVTVSDGEEIFVADYENQMVQMFPLHDTCVQEFPTVVSRSYSLFFFLSGELTMDPNDLAFDGQRNMWVVGSTDSAEFAVQYNKQGKVLRKLDLQKTGWLRGVAVDTRRNRILITQTTGDEESPHGEVLVFSPEGTLVRTVGWQQGMKSPQFLTVDGKGSILVSDFGSHCVFVYSEDGDLLFQFGGHGHNDGQLSDPRGICTDRLGNIIVADSGNNRVEMFDKTGRFLKHMATDMKDPHAVAMAPQGQLVVTRHR
ncbi:protein meiotic P26-like [Branchiostoma floridae x Branchiostoma japonicum]